MVWGRLETLTQDIYPDVSFFIVFVAEDVQCMHIILFGECLCLFMTVHVLVCAQQMIDKCGVFICVCASVWCLSVRPKTTPDRQLGCVCVCVVCVHLGGAVCRPQSGVSSRRGRSSLCYSPVAPILLLIASNIAPSVPNFGFLIVPYVLPSSNLWTLSDQPSLRLRLLNCLSQMWHLWSILMIFMDLGLKNCVW